MGLDDWSGPVLLIPHTTDKAIWTLIVHTFMDTIAIWFMIRYIMTHVLLFGAALIALYVITDYRLASWRDYGSVMMHGSGWSVRSQSTLGA